MNDILAIYISHTFNVNNVIIMLLLFHSVIDESFRLILALGYKPVTVSSK